MSMPISHVPPVPVEYLDARQAAEYARRSYQTLKRLHRPPDRDTGLRRHNRRVVFHFETLRRFLAVEYGE